MQQIFKHWCGKRCFGNYRTVLKHTNVWKKCCLRIRMCKR